MPHGSDSPRLLALEGVKAPPHREGSDSSRLLALEGAAAWALRGEPALYSTEHCYQSTLTNPTITEAVKLTAAHDYFNKTLFNGELNPCRISIASNGNSKWRGQFSPKKVTAGEESFDQILIDTDYTAECVEEKNLKLLFSTLVHEMCHQALPTSGHNEDWRDMMFSLGLEPVQVTKGRWSNATHQIIDGGLFDRACSNIPEDIINDWLSFRVQTEKKTKPFTKVVSCPVCGGKTVIKSRTFRVKCFDHDVEMV